VENQLRLSPAACKVVDVTDVLSRMTGAHFGVVLREKYGSEIPAEWDAGWYRLIEDGEGWLWTLDAIRHLIETRALSAEDTATAIALARDNQFARMSDFVESILLDYQTTLAA